MEKYASSTTETSAIAEKPSIATESSPFALEVVRPLEIIRPLHEFSAASGTAEDAVQVDSYGQGQVSGVTYTVPAHGEINVKFDIKMQCVTPAGIKQMDQMIRTLLSASKRHEYDQLSKTSVSGGVSFFAFWSGGAKASYDDTKRTMDRWGLSEENQKEIVEFMINLASEFNEFNYEGTISNKDFDFSVSGNMFAIVMDATIKQGTSSKQMRFLAPQTHLKDSANSVDLPTLELLY